MKPIPQPVTATPRRFGRAEKSHFNPARDASPAMLPFRLIGSDAQQLEAPAARKLAEAKPPSQITWHKVQ